MHKNIAKPVFRIVILLCFQQRVVGTAHRNERRDAAGDDQRHGDYLSAKVQNVAKQFFEQGTLHISPFKVGRPGLGAVPVDRQYLSAADVYHPIGHLPDRDIVSDDSRRRS